MEASLTPSSPDQNVLSFIGPFYSGLARWVCLFLVNNFLRRVVSKIWSFGDNTKHSRGSGTNWRESTFSQKENWQKGQIILHGREIPTLFRHIPQIHRSSYIFLFARKIAMTFMNGGEEGFRGLFQTLLFPNILSSGCQGGATMFEKKFFPETKQMRWLKRRNPQKTTLSLHLQKEWRDSVTWKIVS